MKGSGINYFFNNIGLDTGAFKVLYTFEDGAGDVVSSVPLGQSQYSGVLSSVGTFWSKPGSGFFNGNSLAVSNASGLASTSFVHLFGVRKVNTAGGILFSSQNGNSGYSIGLTDSNRVYLETRNGQEVVTASYTQLAAKDILAVSRVGNSIAFSYYDFNAQSFETEAFTVSLGAMNSDSWTLCPSFTGYLDYYAYFSSFYSPNVLSQIASGFYNTPTGSAYQTTTVCVSVLTGYSGVPFVTTGVVGYQTINSGDGGTAGFGGAFPIATVTVPITSILNSGLFQSGVTGLSCTIYTGDLITLFDTNIGYASGFGMQKALMLRHIESGDIVKFSSNALFNPIYNRAVNPLVSGYDMGVAYDTGQVNLFWNGLFTENTGFSLTGRYLFVANAQLGDIVTYDLFSGVKQNLTGDSFALTYTGQEVYLNGLNLVSGLDFTTSGNALYLTPANSGLSGLFMVSPIGLPYVTGELQIITPSTFARNTSNVYLNGVRQQLGQDYVEGGAFDLLLGNDFNENGNTPVYNNNGQHWES